MNNTNPKVDAYIENAAPFARPILAKLRSLFHKACPDIEEKVKWGCPSFERNGMVGGMAAFKKHATFGLWRQDVLPDPDGILRSKSPMGAGKYADVSELPSDRVLIKYIKAAVKLNESGPPARSKVKRKPAPKVPPDFKAALARNKRAKATFDAFSSSCQREYVEWITEAKRETTRAKRLATTIEWLTEGKKRNWKYENC